MCVGPDWGHSCFSAFMLGFCSREGSGPRLVSPTHPLKASSIPMLQILGSRYKEFPYLKNSLASRVGERGGSWATVLLLGRMGGS